MNDKVYFIIKNLNIKEKVFTAYMTASYFDYIKTIQIK